jgi:quercetin dioxygenase-like cupin family protein
VEFARLADAAPYDADGFVAQGLLDTAQCNVRLIRLSPGQALPAHTHGASDLMLYAVEGGGTIDTAEGAVPFTAGTVASLRGDEELRVANTGDDGMTLLAFLSPPFPPASEQHAPERP